MSSRSIRWVVRSVRSGTGFDSSSPGDKRVRRAQLASVCRQGRDRISIIVDPHLIGARFINPREGRLQDQARRRARLSFKRDAHSRQPRLGDRPGKNSIVQTVASHDIDHVTSRLDRFQYGLRQSVPRGLPPRSRSTSTRLTSAAERFFPLPNIKPSGAYWSDLLLRTDEFDPRDESCESLSRRSGGSLLELRCSRPRKRSAHPRPASRRLVLDRLRPGCFASNKATSGNDQCDPGSLHPDPAFNVDIIAPVIELRLELLAGGRNKPMVRIGPDARGPRGRGPFPGNGLGTVDPPLLHSKSREPGTRYSLLTQPWRRAPGSSPPGYRSRSSASVMTALGNMQPSQQMWRIFLVSLPFSSRSQNPA